MIHVESALASAREALEAGRSAAAERELLAVLDFDDREPRALRLLGEVVRDRGEYQRAAELFERALDVCDPPGRGGAKGPRPTPTLAELYVEQGYPEAGAGIYRQLLEEEGDGGREEWRRRLAELEGGAGETGPETAPVEPMRGGAQVQDPESGTDSLGETLPDGGEGPEIEERRLRLFLEQLERHRETVRLGRFLERLGGSPSGGN